MLAVSVGRGLSKFFGGAQGFNERLYHTRSSYINEDYADAKMVMTTTKKNTTIAKLYRKSDWKGRARNKVG